MTTITTREIIKTMLYNNGTYPGDPQAFSIWQYKTPLGDTVWSACYNIADELALRTSRDVIAPRLLWNRDSGHVSFMSSASTCVDMNPNVIISTHDDVRGFIAKTMRSIVVVRMHTELPVRCCICLNVATTANGLVAMVNYAPSTAAPFVCPSCATWLIDNLMGHLVAVSVKLKLRRESGEDDEEQERLP